MALVHDRLLVSILVCNVGMLFLSCSVLAQPQKLGVIFDEPKTKMARLNSQASLSCYVYGDVKTLTSQWNNIQVVRNKGDAETLVYERGKVTPEQYSVTTNIITYTPSKFHILVKILSVQTYDDAQYICRFIEQNGTVHHNSVKLQVYAKPDQIVCGQRKFGNTFEVTCTMVVYPSGNCYVQLTDSQDSQSSSVSYDRYQDEKGVYTTTCTVQGATSRQFRIAFDPNIPDFPDPKNFTVYSDVISDPSSLAYISNFEANDRSSSAVQVDMGDDLDLECKARGSTPARIYLFRVRPGEIHRRLLRGANNQISYEIDAVTCSDEGDYYCMAGYDQDHSRKITVVTTSCGGSTLSPTDYEYKDLSRNLIIICSTLGVGGLALIISIIICAFCCIKRRRARMARTAANGGIILSVPTASDHEHLYSDSLQVETSLQMSPPPYSSICDKEGIHDLAPPPYPGVTDKNNSHPVGVIGQETPTPPPYSRK